MNTAARMESTSEPLRIQCSQSTVDLLRSEADGDRWLIESRGETVVKGKGKMSTFWLLGSRDEADNRQT